MTTPAKALTFRAMIAMAPASLGGACLVAVLSAGLSLLPFVLLYRMALEITAPAPDVPQIRLLALEALGVVLARWATMAISHALAHLGAFTILYRLRIGLARRLLHAPLEFIGRRGSGTMRKTVLDDTSAMEGFLAHMLPDAVAAAVVPLAALGLLFTVDWRLTLAALLPLPVAIAVQVAMMRGAPERMRKWQALQDGIASQIVSYLRVIPVVKLFGLSARSFGDLAGSIEGAVAWVDRYAARTAAGWAVFMALLSANLVVVAPLAAWLHARGELSAAAMVLFLLVAPVVLQPLLRLTFAFGEQARRAAALERINELWTLPTAIEPPQGKLPPRDAPHDITFEGVSFAYDAAHGPVLSDISFTAPAGGVTALVGPSGAGKSTIIRLLPRFHEIAGGAITLAGRDLRDWPLDRLQARLGIVFQEVFLFHGSVRDNLLIARPQASEAEIEAAARAARAHDFIMALPDGYDTRLGERGARLSGGERQRLSIARALLKDAPVLLLDEATAHADAESEHLIQQALGQLRRGRTVITVAHRLHSLRDADSIVLVDRGRVVDQGDHAMLLERCALYRQLWHDSESSRSWTLQPNLHRETQP